MTGAAVNVGQWPQVEIMLQRYKAKMWGTSLVVQWLRLWAPNAGAPCSIPGQGTGCYTPQLRIHKLKLKIPRATAKTWCSQINNKFFYKSKNMVRWAVDSRAVCARVLLPPSHSLYRETWVFEYNILNHVKLIEGILPEKCDFSGPPQISWHIYSSWSPPLEGKCYGLNCVLWNNRKSLVSASSSQHWAPKAPVIF